MSSKKNWQKRTYTHTSNKQDVVEKNKTEKITLQIVSAVAVVKHLFHEYYPY